VTGGSLSGRVAVVTGGARGIGDAVAGALAGEGAGVVSLDRDPPDDERAGVRYAQADVSDPASVEAAFAEVDATEGGLDVLVNNAGIQRVGRTGELPYADWAAVIATNLTGAFLCSSQAVPRMRRRGGGSIVSVSSGAAFVGLPGRAAYCAAKAGLLGMSRAMAVELAPAAIRVNAVAPGYTRTGLVERAIGEGFLAEEWMLERIPMGRLAAPEEIARAVLWLAGDESAYVTGQAIVVDGGWTIQGVGRAGRLDDDETTPEAR
jgi:NAD(P)-dependent dehydrogenase (short-subunit alcohol dehydrogenase family)